MMLRRPKSREIELNLSSFADIAFLLIIFFILTTAFLKFEGTTMDIPAGEPKDEADDKTPTILLTNEEIRFGKNTLTIDQLRKTLLDNKYPEKKDTEKVIVLECKEDVVYQNYYAVITAIHSAGAVMALQVEGKDDE